jgi:hypothetical protein
MNRNTNLRDMKAPEVASGKIAGDTVLAHTAIYPLPSEKEGNTLEEYKTPKQPKSELGGHNTFS